MKRIITIAKYGPHIPEIARCEALLEGDGDIVGWTYLDFLPHAYQTDSGRVVVDREGEKPGLMKADFFDRDGKLSAEVKTEKLRID